MVAFRDPANELNETLALASELLAAGQADEALGALRAVPPQEQNRLTVLALRCAILLGQESWTMAAVLAETLAENEPHDPSHWVNWAFAVRRRTSLDAAEKILREGYVLHPRSSVIAFNLACYCAQSQRLEEARRLLRQALALNQALLAAAESDPDLAPLRESLPPQHGLSNGA